MQNLSFRLCNNLSTWGLSMMTKSIKLENGLEAGYNKYWLLKSLTHNNQIREKPENQIIPNNIRRIISSYKLDLLPNSTNFYSSSGLMKLTVPRKV